MQITFLMLAHLDRLKKIFISSDIKKNFYKFGNCMQKTHKLFFQRQEVYTTVEKAKTRENVHRELFCLAGTGCKREKS